MTPLPTRLDGARLTCTGNQVAVTPHYLASQAAIDVMAQGGNAVDAAIAANATLGVVAPETCGIGGDLFALVHIAGNPIPQALNSSGRAGSGASAANLRANGYSEIPTRSPWAVTVPGCVDGWVALAERHGTMPLRDLLDRPIELADSGFSVTPELSGALTRLQDILAGQAAADGLYPEAVPPQPGAIIRRRRLGRTLDKIATFGREAVYAGEVGEQLTAATDGVLMPDDLAIDQAEWVNPISTETMGWTGWTIPPNSQGYLTLAAAWIFEQLDPPHDPEDPRFVHAAVEAYRSVAWERSNLVADPISTPIDQQQLLDPDRLRPRLERLSMRWRADWPTRTPAPGGTAYLCVRDSTGMGVSLIQSNFHGIGSGIGVGDSGFFLHDRGSGFTLQPGHPNELAPGKRPFHTLSPTLWTEGSSLALLLGTRGGRFQPQTLLQFLTYLRWAGVDSPTAQQLPRWTIKEGFGSDSAVVTEPHFTPAVISGLAGRGHTVETAPGWVSGWGPVAAITVSDNRATGAADPRVASTAALSDG